MKRYLLRHLAFLSLTLVLMMNLAFAGTATGTLQVSLTILPPLPASVQQDQTIYVHEAINDDSGDDRVVQF